MKRIISVLLFMFLLNAAFIFNSSADEFDVDASGLKLAEWKMSPQLENADTESAGYRVVNSAPNPKGDIWINATNTVSPTMGVINTAVKLMGNEDFMGVIDEPLGNMLNERSELTLSAWVNFAALPDAGETVMLFDQEEVFRVAVENGGNIHVAMVTADCSWYGKILRASGAIRINTWQNIAITLDSSGVKLYVDGVLRGENSEMKGAIIANKNMFKIGNIPTGNKALTRSFDDVVIYSSAFTAEQIKRMANKPIIYLNGETNENKIKNYGVIADISLNAENTVMNNSGKLGSAISYESKKAGDSLAVLWNQDHNGALDFTNQMTFASWIKPTGNGDVMLLERDGVYRTVLTNDGLIQGTVRTQNNGWYEVAPYSTKVTCPKNVWSHVAVTYNGSMVSVYINGKLVAGEAATGDIIYTDAEANLGIFSPVYLCKADSGAGVDLDELQIYDRALTAEEIEGLFSLQRKAEVRNIVGDPIRNTTGGSKVYADVSGVFEKNNTPTVTLILAAYNNEDRLIAIEIVDENNIQNVNKESLPYLCTPLMEIPGSSNDIVQLKSYLWESLASLTPIQ